MSGAPQAGIRWTGPDGLPRRLRLGPEEAIVGRHAGCALVLTHSTVSREQAKILWSQGEFLLVDLASVNGTFVNGRRIQACVLRNGDRVRFGQAPEEVYFEGRPEAAGSVLHEVGHHPPPESLSPERLER